MLHSKQAEELFQRLSQALEKFQDWVVLGSVDVESLVEQYCHTVPDWEKNFKALKARGREAEKLPKYEGREPFSVHTSLFSSSPVLSTLTVLLFPHCL